MEEEHVDFDEFMKTFTLPEVKFYAKFNTETGAVSKVGPQHAFTEEEMASSVIEIDQELADRILNGNVPLFKCFVDVTTENLEVVEEKSLRKIDDVLHRVMDVEWAEIENPDIFVSYSRADKKLTIELSEELNGTYKNSTQAKKRKMFWAGDTKMNFLLTKYSDPHVILESFDLQLQDLEEKAVTFENVEFPERFSFYTRRLFKNYVIEVK